MPQINEAETEVLSPVGLEQFHFQIWEFCMAIVECSSPLVVWCPLAMVFCGGPNSDGQWSLQQEASQCGGPPYQNHWSEGVSWAEAVLGESPIFLEVMVVEVPVLTGGGARSLAKGHTVGLNVGEQNPELLQRWPCEVPAVFTLMQLAWGTINPIRGQPLPIPGRKGLSCLSQ